MRPPLPQVGHFLIPNPWQSKHFHLSKMLPFFLFLPVPLQPSHSTAPFPLHVLQPEATSLAPDLDAMAGSILVLGVTGCRHKKQLRFVAVDALKETKLALAGSMAAAAACLRNFPSFTALCSAMHKANHPQASEEERQRTATGKLCSHRNKEYEF